MSDKSRIDRMMAERIRIMKQRQERLDEIYLKRQKNNSNFTKRLADAINNKNIPKMKSKFNKRLEEAMRASKEAKKKVGQRGGFQGFIYNTPTGHTGTYSSGSYTTGDAGGYIAETRRQLREAGISGQHEISKKLDKMMDESFGQINKLSGIPKEVLGAPESAKAACAYEMGIPQQSFGAPEHYGQTQSPKRPIGHLEAEEKFNHMELSEYGTLHIRMNQKQEYYCLFDLHTLFKPTHRVFDFLEKHKQFDVVTEKAGTFLKTVRIKSFKIMLEDFLGYGEEVEQTKD